MFIPKLEYFLEKRNDFVFFKIKANYTIFDANACACGFVYKDSLIEEMLQHMDRKESFQESCIRFDKE